jgi:hypothetical protein
MLVKDMTHDDIADFVAMRLRKMDYPLSFSNITSVNIGEQPDVLGVTLYGESLLGEVKVSRSDYLKDKKKPWRNDGYGMGERRVYVTPKGLLNPDEIPHGWMLWEVHGKNKPTLKVIKGKAMKRIQHPHMSEGNFTSIPEYRCCDVDEYNHFQSNWKNKSFQKELIITVEVMRRAAENGIELNNFANKYQSVT